jgi:HD-like signal output (HDOD) protein/CheY-like chemotaxis protein
MDKTSILFVDDEEQLLFGLRRMLREKRQDWDMQFVGSGKEALEVMSKKSFDVVVSDMRMPVMNGAELLSIIRERHPSTIRIILSGYVENEALLQSVGPSHQYLAKPCDSKTLKNTIDRALMVRERIGGANLRDLVSALGRMPTPSATYYKLTEELTSPKATIQSVSNIIERDITLAAQTLKLTNSAYFALPNNVNSIEQAVRLLGFKTLRNLVFVAGFYEAFSGDDWQMQTLEKLNRRSFTMARLAKRICQSEGLSESECEIAFSAALLAHVGTLVLVMNRPDDFERVIEEVEKNNRSIMEAEHAAFGASHASIGAYLLGLWGFSDPVVESVAFHHQPEVVDDSKFTASTAVYIAQYISRRSAERLDCVERYIKSELNEMALAEAGQLERLSAWESLHEETNCE